eukprot:16451725-Heterocapsa_arctica.AAC.1
MGDPCRISLPPEPDARPQLQLNIVEPPFLRLHEPKPYASNTWNHTYIGHSNPTLPARQWSGLGGRTPDTSPMTATSHPRRSSGSSPPGGDRGVGQGEGAPGARRAALSGFLTDHGRGRRGQERRRRRQVCELRQRPERAPQAVPMARVLPRGERGHERRRRTVLRRPPGRQGGRPRCG